jgi:hypothetical protein
MQSNLARDLAARLRAAELRAGVFSGLRSLIGIPPQSDLTEQQWSALESALQDERARLMRKIGLGKSLLSACADLTDARRINALLGEIEMDLSRAFVFFDTYVDVLTQRVSAELGPLLAGCDALARDSLKKSHPTLQQAEDPLVYCDRGFGASMLRGGVQFPSGVRNPIPLVQIPYEKLGRKYTLTSVLHEVGHEAMIRLGLDRELPTTLRSAALEAGGHERVADLVGLWSYEIGPDFWAFCGAGPAQAMGAKDVLSLPASSVFRYSATDPHPPPYLRVLLSFEWCRQEWGSGDWDSHDRAWRELYPLRDLSRLAKDFFDAASQLLPAIATALRLRRFKSLGDRRISDLFSREGLEPAQLERAGRGATSGTLDLRGLSSSVQLAVFRRIRDQSLMGEAAIDRVMSRWLRQLAVHREASHKLSKEHIL